MLTKCSFYCGCDFKCRLPPEALGINRLVACFLAPRNAVCKGHVIAGSCIWVYCIPSIFLPLPVGSSEGDHSVASLWEGIQSV